MVNQLTVLFLVVKKNWKLKSALLCILLIKIDQGELEIVMWITYVHMIFLVAAFKKV